MVYHTICVPGVVIEGIQRGFNRGSVNSDLNFNMN